MRIVSLLASGSEIVCGMGAGDMLVGRSHECDNPGWIKKLPICTRPAFDINVSSRAIDLEVRRRIHAGEPLYHVDAELINSLKPDVLITQAHCEVCAVTPGDVKRSGCAVAGTVLALEAGSVKGIFEGVASIGNALERQQAAKDLIAKMRGRMEAIGRDAQQARPPSVVVIEWTDPIFCLANWGPELVEMAGGLPLVNQRGVHSAAIDWQIVRDADPEFLVVAPCGFDLQRTMQEIPVLESLPGWFEMHAVRNAKVALADGNKYFNRSGTTIVQTVEILAEILHGRDFGHRNAAWTNYYQHRAATVVQHVHAEAVAKGKTSYADPATGYEVFTSLGLKQRGYCCENGCRHCPYQSEIKPASTALP